MKMSKIKEMTNDELVSQIKELQDESLKLKIQVKTGQIKNPVRINDIRKDIARIKTQQNAKLADSK